MKKVLFIVVLLFGIIGQLWADNQIIETLIGHWFIAEKNAHYSSGQNVNYEEIVTNSFVFNDDGSGFWLVETEKNHASGTSEKNEEKINYNWKIQDKKVVLDFFEMGRAFESDFEISDSILTLSDSEGNTKKDSKKQS